MAGEKEELEITDGLDAEIAAIGECVRVLNPLGPDQLRRVFDYLGRRYLDRFENERREVDREIRRVEKLAAEETE